MTYDIRVNTTDGPLTAKDIASARLISSQSYSNISTGDSFFIPNWNANFGSYTLVTTDGLDACGIEISNPSSSGTTVTFIRNDSQSVGIAQYNDDFVSQSRNFVVNYYHTDESYGAGDGHGIVVINDSSSVVLDSEYPTMALDRVKTLDYMTQISYTVEPGFGFITTGFVDGSQDGRNLNDFFVYDLGSISTDEQVFVELSVGEEVYCVNPRVRSGATLYGYSEWDNKFCIFRSTANAEVSVMKSIPDISSIPGSEYGLSIFTSNNVLTYNSNAALNRIIGDHSMTLDGRQSGADPIGSFSIESNVTHLSIPTSLKQITFCGELPQSGSSGAVRGFWCWGLHRDSLTSVRVVRGLFAVVGTGVSPQIFPTVSIEHGLLSARITGQ